MYKSPYIFDESRQSESLSLYVYDPDFTLLGIISDYVSIVWEEEYQGRGKFLLVCIDTDENIKILQQGNYIARRGKDTAMIIRYLKFHTFDNTIIAQGYTTNDLLHQMVLYKTISIGNAEKGMYDLVNSSRDGMQYHVSAPSKNLPQTFVTQFTGANILEACSVIGKETQLGFYTKFDSENKKHIFTVYQGRDLSYDNTLNNPIKMFSDEFQNLENMTIIDDMSNFANVAYVAGSGDGDARTWVIVGSAKGRHAYKIFVDARDLQIKEGQTQAQYEALLSARGIQKLNDRLRVYTVIGEVNPRGFGDDFYLGDIISCESKKYGVTLDTRILHYAEVRENNITRLKLTLGNPEITTKSEVKNWLNEVIP